MNFVTVAENISDAINRLDGIRAYPYVPDSIDPPCAIVAYPDIINYDITYSNNSVDGADSSTVPVVVLVANTNDRTASKSLLTFASRGVDSIKNAIEKADEEADIVHVATCEFDRLKLGGSEYVVAVFSVRVSGS